MASKNIPVSLNELTPFIESLLEAGGFNGGEAKAVARSLILSELSGHGSHGLVRVSQYLGLLQRGLLVSGRDFRIVQETPGSLTADAQAGVGQALMPKLLSRLYAKLETSAVVSAAVRNCGHVGRLGEWVEDAAQAGYVAFLTVNDNGACFHVAPPGGKKAATSTNPIAFAVPLPDGKIFSTDMSTSAIAFGKAKLAHLTKTRLQPGCIQDADAHPTTDPAALFSTPPGSILPMGGAQGYKGFALAMFVDMLTAGLSGGQAPPADADAEYPKSMLNNLVLTLWNPKFFAGGAHLGQQAAKLIDAVRHSPPIDPERPVRLPGDRMNAVRQRAEDCGLELNENLIQELNGLARKLGGMPVVTRAVP